jgi:hypothetical protein
LLHQAEQGAVKEKAAHSEAEQKEKLKQERIWRNILV